VQPWCDPGDSTVCRTWLRQANLRLSTFQQANSTHRGSGHCSCIISTQGFWGTAAQRMYVCAQGCTTTCVGTMSQAAARSRRDAAFAGSRNDASARRRRRLGRASSFCLSDDDERRHDDDDGGGGGDDDDDKRRATTPIMAMLTYGWASPMVPQ
jgi:hypothetical protein